jgi:rare lipoprotein A
MFIRDFTSRPIQKFPVARTVHGKIVSAFAACIVCVSGASANAAAYSLSEFAMTPYARHGLSASAATSSSASFNDRFDGLQISLFSDAFAVPIILDSPEPLVTGSLPAKDDPLNPASSRRKFPQVEVVIGIASTYNPLDPKDRDAGNKELASGEHYDADGWTAAIRTDLRDLFGGVRYGRNYQPTFALVKSNEKQLIVRINDVGPLKPGRVIDLNERAMRFFDPTMQLGLIDNIRVTPLPGQDWALGPVIDDSPVAVASRVELPAP